MIEYVVRPSKGEGCESYVVWKVEDGEKKGVAFIGAPDDARWVAEALNRREITRP